MARLLITSLGVHVQRRARPGLIDVDGKLIVVITGGDFAPRLDDRFRDFRLELAQVPLATAAATFTRPSARIKRFGNGWPEIGKFSTARCVWAP